ncbi:MAG: serine/threonine-protein kinase [Candidatus Eisenbacteria bacterium]
MPTPERLGKYTISAVLGRGAMGVVYKGLDPIIGRPVAIKTIRRDLVSGRHGDALTVRFRNEARAAGRLSHPGIVGIYEYGEDGDVAFLAMEFVEGSTLSDYLDREIRFASADIVGIMNQVLDALGFAHDHGIWHRDIKPANIIIGRNGKLKIADFGIAHVDSSNITHTGAMMGTPAYMAPEHFHGNEVDARADLFSCGVVLYQLLTGVRPWEGVSAVLAYKICHEEPRRPSEIDPTHCPSPFDAIVARALAKSPSDRYQTAAEFQAEVSGASVDPVPACVSEETLFAGPPPDLSGLDLEVQTGLGSEPTSPSACTDPPTGWDPDILGQVRDQLAHYLGPLARVVIRRAAAKNSGLDDLYRAAAEDLLNPLDRESFLAEGRAFRERIAHSMISDSGLTSGGGTMSGGGMTSGDGLTRGSGMTSSGARADGSGPSQGSAGGAPDGAAGVASDGGNISGVSGSPSGGAGALGRPLDEATLAETTRCLAAYVGPIAKILVKKSAGQATNADELFEVLAAQMTDATDREKFLRDVRSA